ncbi:YecA family protein [Rhizobium sp. 22-785-1]
MKAFQRRPARSAPCPCGSGKKFKHCHGAVSRPEGTTPDPLTQRLVAERARAAELARKLQHGYGRPLVSFVFNGQRFVAVGTRVIGSPRWRFFSDFLLANLRGVLGSEWISSLSATMPDHPLLRWLGKLEAKFAEVGGGAKIDVVGWVSALNRLSYAVYLIEHNDKLPNSLLKRLRQSAQFDAACYEAIVASAFAIAGASVDGAEDGRAGNKPTPEFYASFSGRDRYSVEAKRKKSWQNQFDPSNEDFVNELRRWIRDKIYAASKKRLTNPVYWLELSLGVELTREDAELLQKLVGSAVGEAEDLTVGGTPAEPAYVVVTNNPDFASDEIRSITNFALLGGYRMPDFREGVVDIETALERHDKHRPIRRVLECMEEVQQVPIRFDVVPDELIDEQGVPLPVAGIGDRIVYPCADGSESTGLITEATVGGEDVFYVVADEKDGKQVIVKSPLTEPEKRAVQTYGNTIFGKPELPQTNTNDPMRFYDRMLEIFQDYPREALLRQLEGHPQRKDFENLPRTALVSRAARELTKVVVARADADNALGVGHSRRAGESNNEVA